MILAALLLAAAPTGPQADYVEARTASVYAGACHAAGEYTTQGREAVLAWRFTAGAVDGVELAGTEVVALLAADRNLAETDARTRSVLIVDAAAPEAARAAALEAVRRASAARLGDVLEVRVAPVDVEVTRGEGVETFAVRAGHAVRLSGSTLPDRRCCAMPFDRWYEPLVAPAPDTVALVGRCAELRVRDAALERAFVRRNENCVFLARVALPAGGPDVAAR